MKNYSIREIMNLKGVSYDTVYDRVKDGRVHSIRDSAGTYFIPESELEKLPRPRKLKGVVSTQAVSPENERFSEGTPFFQIWTPQQVLNWEGMQTLREMLGFHRTPLVLGGKALS